MSKYTIKPKTPSAAAAATGANYSTALDPSTLGIVPIGAVSAVGGDQIWSPAFIINEFVSTTETAIRLKRDSVSSILNCAVGDILVACPGTGQILTGLATLEYLRVTACPTNPLLPNSITVARDFGDRIASHKSYTAGTILLKVGKLNSSYGFMWMDSASDTLKCMVSVASNSHTTGFTTDPFNAAAIKGAFGDPDGQGVKLVAAVMGTSTAMVDGSPSGAGVLINSAGIKGYNSSSKNTFSLDAATGLADFAGATPHTVPGQLQVGPSGSGILIDGTTASGPIIKSNNYTATTSGFIVSPDLIESANLRARATFECYTLKANTTSAVNGTLLVSKSSALVGDISTTDAFICTLDDSFAVADFVYMQTAGSKAEGVCISSTGSVVQMGAYVKSDGTKVDFSYAYSGSGNLRIYKASHGLDDSLITFQGDMATIYGAGPFLAVRGDDNYFTVWNAGETAAIAYDTDYVHGYKYSVTRGISGVVKKTVTIDSTNLTYHGTYAVFHDASGHTFSNGNVIALLAGGLIIAAKVVLTTGDPTTDFYADYQGTYSTQSFVPNAWCSTAGGTAYEYNTYAWNKGVAVSAYSSGTTSTPIVKIGIDAGYPYIQLNKNVFDPRFGNGTNYVELKDAGLAIKKGGDISLEYDASNPASLNFNASSGNTDYSMYYAPGGSGDYCFWSNADANVYIYMYTGTTKDIHIQAYDKVYLGDDVYITANCSAGSFTDRTKYFVGDAIKELLTIKADKDGNLDHTTLPIFAQKVVPTNKEGKASANIERDLGAMISLLTVAAQQLTTRIEALEKK